MVSLQGLGYSNGAFNALYRCMDIYIGELVSVHSSPMVGSGL